MTEKAINFTGFRPMTAEQSEFFTKNLLDVFRQLDKMKGINNNDMRGRTHDETPRSDSPPDHGDHRDR